VEWEEEAFVGGGITTNHHRQLPFRMQSPIAVTTSTLPLLLSQIAYSTQYQTSIKEQREMPHLMDFAKARSGGEECLLPRN
jgi:hypothetical protein